MRTGTTTPQEIMKEIVAKYPTREALPFIVNNIVELHRLFESDQAIAITDALKKLHELTKRVERTWEVALPDNMDRLETIESNGCNTFAVHLNKLVASITEFQRALRYFKAHNAHYCYLESQLKTQQDGGALDKGILEISRDSLFSQFDVTYQLTRMHKTTKTVAQPIPPIVQAKQVEQLWNAILKSPFVAHYNTVTPQQNTCSPTQTPAPTSSMPVAPSPTDGAASNDSIGTTTAWSVSFFPDGRSPSCSGQVVARSPSPSDLLELRPIASVNVIHI